MLGGDVIGDQNQPASRTLASARTLDRIGKFAAPAQRNVLRRAARPDRAYRQIKRRAVFERRRDGGAKRCAVVLVHARIKV